MNRSGIQVVVFDAVGTLIYPDPPVEAVYCGVGNRFGSRLDEPAVAARFREIFRQEESLENGDSVTNEAVEMERWRRIVGRVLHDVADLDGCFADLFAHFAQPDSWRAFPDAIEALASLRAGGVRVAVASNFDRRLLSILPALEPIGPLDFILVCTEVGYRKPHPEFFNAIAARAGVEPAGILYVGDDAEIDLAPCIAAGMHGRLIDRYADLPTAMRSLNQIQSELVERSEWR